MASRSASTAAKQKDQAYATIQHVMKQYTFKTASCAASDKCSIKVLCTHVQFCERAAWRSATVQLHVHIYECKGCWRTCGVVCQVGYLQAALGATRQLHLVVLVGTLQHSESQLARRLGSGALVQMV
jgi:hypothetical protein